MRERRWERGWKDGERDGKGGDNGIGPPPIFPDVVAPMYWHTYLI